MHLPLAEVFVMLDAILSTYSSLAILGFFVAIIGAIVTAAVDSTQTMPQAQAHQP